MSSARASAAYPPLARYASRLSGIDAADASQQPQRRAADCGARRGAVREGRVDWRYLTRSRRIAGLNDERCRRPIA